MTNHTSVPIRVDSVLYSPAKVAVTTRLEASVVSRENAKDRKRALPLKRDFASAPHWLELARARNVRLPLWTTPCTTSGMRRWLRRAGLSVGWYRRWSGYRSLQEWIDANPRWPLRAFAGICLEECEIAEPHDRSESRSRQNGASAFQVVM